MRATAAALGAFALSAALAPAAQLGRISARRRVAEPAAPTASRARAVLSAQEAAEIAARPSIADRIRALAGQPPAGRPPTAAPRNAAEAVALARARHAASRRRAAAAARVTRRVRGDAPPPGLPVAPAADPGPPAPAAPRAGGGPPAAPGAPPPPAEVLSSKLAPAGLLPSAPPPGAAPGIYAPAFRIERFRPRMVGAELHAGSKKHPAVDIDRRGEGMAPLLGVGRHAEAPARARPQRPRHRVADRLSDGAGGEETARFRELTRTFSFPRTDPYVPHGLFHPLPSTRTVTALAAYGDRLLVGTTGGLLIHDPATGATQNVTPGIKVSAIGHDLVSPEAALVATERGLFRYYDGGVNHHLSPAVTSVMAIPSRELLITGHRYGVVHWLRPDGNQRLTQVETRAPIRFLVVHDRQIFAANGEGLWTIDSGGGTLEVSIDDDPLAQTVTWLGVYGGAVHAGTPAGLFRRGDAGWTRVGPPIHVLGADRVGDELFVGTPSEGTWRVAGGRLSRLGLGLDGATAFRELGGRVYIGTRDEGVHVLRRGAGGFRATRLYDPSGEPPGNQIMGLAYARDHGALFVGTYDHGVGRLDYSGRWTPLTEADGLPSLWTNEVATDGRRVIVRVSDGTVAESFDGARFRVLGPKTGWPKTWTSIAGTAEGSLFVGTHDGFYLGQGNDWDIRFPVEPLKRRMVLAAARGKGRTYVGTHKSGMWVQDNRSGAWRQFSVVTGLPDSWVKALTWFRGDLWVGTFNSGVVRIPDGGLATPSWERFRKADGALPSDHVRCMVATDRDLWIGTMWGLVRYDGRAFTSFSHRDGLQDESVLSLATDGRTLWIGTPTGLMAANLDQLRVATPTLVASR